MEEYKEKTSLYFKLQWTGIFIAILGLIIVSVWLYNKPSWEPLFALITILLAIIGFLGYFASNYKRFIFRKNKDSLIYAKLLEQHSEERRNGFDALRQDIKKGDQIWILGTGVTSFLADHGNLESYLKNGAQIRVLMINDILLKTDRSCQEEGARKFFEQVRKYPKIVKKIENEFLCDIQKCNFLIQQQHFNNYFQRENYHEKVQESYKTIRKMKEIIKANNWLGSIDAKHFSTFFPLSMTVVNPNKDNDMRMIIEFVLPFTDQRLLLQYPQNKGDVQLFKMFINFFNNTWNNDFSANID